MHNYELLRERVPVQLNKVSIMNHHRLLSYLLFILKAPGGRGGGGGWMGGVMMENDISFISILFY